MGVPKIAVIALVAIIAVPILLGYAMNLTQVSESGYKSTGDSVNVTPLLQNGTGSNYAHSDVFQLNTNINISGAQFIPIYESLTTIKSSYNLRIDTFAAGTHPSWGGASGVALSLFNYLGFASDNEGTGTRLGINYVKSDMTLIQSVPNLHSLYFDSKTMKITFIQYSGSYLNGFTLDVSSLDNRIVLTDGGNYQGTCYTAYSLANGSTYNYANLSAGFHIDFSRLTSTSPAYYPGVTMPNDVKNALMTINLDSITDANYYITIDGIKFEKTTVAGVVSWTATNTITSETVDLYYDPTINDNSYQFFEDVEYESPHRTTYELRYVGHWPTLIGEANYYQKYTFERSSRLAFNSIQFTQSSNSRTPTVRMDDALFKAFEYPVITNRTYDPSTFKTNPVTTISDLQLYGTSLTFAGVTYTVNEGMISLNGHNIPVNDLKLSSSLNEGGTYDNKIGNTLVSTTATPSTITFSGAWAASISTDSQETYTYTHTEWIPGHFAWDGIDQNFLMVGLITCLGVFIALGIYARKKGSGGLIPLMIAVGCAAMVFFVML